MLEGLDGSGTTTQTALLLAELVRQGYAAVATREPTPGPVGRLLREVLTERVERSPGQPARLGWETLALLFAADRMDHCDAELGPWLAKGRVVISDRYDLSSRLYQSLTAPDGADAAGFVRQVNARGLRPDLVVVLDVPAAVAEARREARGGAPELFERLELQRRLAEAYQNVGRDEPETDEVLHLDGTLSVEELARQLTNLVLARLTSRSSELA